MVPEQNHTASTETTKTLSQGHRVLSTTIFPWLICLTLYVMKPIDCVSLCLLSLSMLSISGCAGDVEPLRPNIVLIVADDLGYADIGAFGSEIRTPSLDTLAARGLTLTNFHTAPTCGPTRAMLMTGIDAHPVGMAANAAAVKRIEALQGRRGYDGRLNGDAVTVAKLLSDSGYQTYMSGKWDLGRFEGSRPIDRGFQKSFALTTRRRQSFCGCNGDAVDSVQSTLR